MDIFFDVFAFLKEDYILSRISKLSSEKGTHILIYSDDSLIVRVHDEQASPEYAYLVAAKRLVEWALQNEIPADEKKTSRSWSELLKERLFEVDNAEEGW